MNINFFFFSIQVEETYALVESGYGIMNEFQVAIGESTCAARFWAAPTTAGGKAQIEVREMSRLALERTKTARDAIKLMGSLAEQYGFYAAGAPNKLCINFHRLTFL